MMLVTSGVQRATKIRLFIHNWSLSCDARGPVVTSSPPAALSNRTVGVEEAGREGGGAV